MATKPSSGPRRATRHVDRDLDGRLGPHRVEQLLRRPGSMADGQEALLGAVREEDVGEPRRDDRLEPVVEQCPHGVLARRADPEVRPRDEDRRAREPDVVEDEGRCRRATRRRARAEALALDALQPVRRDDLVGVDVRAVEGRPSPMSRPGPASREVLGGGQCPATAVAAATAGETRCVRPPRPWRPSKFRFDVDAQRSPGASVSGFMARHIEHPARATRTPPRVKIAVEPLGLGLRLHPLRARHAERTDPGLTCPPRSTSAAITEVLDPRVRARADEHGVDRDRREVACRAPDPCTRARAPPPRAPGGRELARVGHREADRGATWPGLVPQVTWVSMTWASSRTSASNIAPVVAPRAPPAATASSNSAPDRCVGPPFEVGERVLVGGDHARAGPASIYMLQTVIRPSIERVSTARPRYSMNVALPPPDPDACRSRRG